MGSNSFGQIFRITTWGESHGKAIGVVIDGCPAMLSLSEEDIHLELDKRRPGVLPGTTERKEPDRCEILSGVYEGKTTGTPISIIIYNQDVKSFNYDQMKDVLRPGHANFTYMAKYGVFDHRGGGRASARETAMRVAAGAVAKKLLSYYHIRIKAYLSSIYTHQTPPLSFDAIQTGLEKSRIFCPCPHTEDEMLTAIKCAQEEGNSLGGTVSLLISDLPAGLGDPIYEKLEANLAKAMLSIPACKAIEFGSGFQSTQMMGSEHNDLYILDGDEIRCATNHAGGILGGISTGMPIELRVAFKPTSSIGKSQRSLTFDKKEASFSLQETKRQDPAVAIRATPVVEAMGALVIADALLMNQNAHLLRISKEIY
ncbi:MAG: chorismate synthase [Simkaniaceae bacterium]|nr:chorismate synthase [Simkaniaceae bacterium]MCF7852792.1 chorismate synthase [Simkaniaceae bacterium]